MTIEVTSYCKQCDASEAEFCGWGQRLAFWKAHHDERGFASMHTCHETSGTLVVRASLVRQFAP